MRFWGYTQFKIKGLNQEKNFNKMANNSLYLFDVNRIEKNCTVFKVAYNDRKKVKKQLLGFGYEILEEKNFGFFPLFFKIFGNIWIISAVVLASVLYFIQSPYIFKFEVLGEENLTKQEIVDYVKDNFPNNKHKINTKKVEGALYENFDEISFASVIIKGQTMVINIKEKLLPEEIYGEFKPIYSDYDGKVVSINLVSGTALVNIGDYVQKGDVLVVPSYTDSLGNVQKVKADAEITLETYSTGEVTFFEERIEVNRTGNFAIIDEIQLFGLTIYQNKPDYDFSLSESEVTYEDISNNLLLPLKLKRTVVYELKEEKIFETYEEAEEKIIESAREKALENLSNYGNIIDEFYTVKHTAGASIVRYVIVEENIIGVHDESWRQNWYLQKKD